MVMHIEFQREEGVAILTSYTAKVMKFESESEHISPILHQLSQDARSKRVDLSGYGWAFWSSNDARLLPSPELAVRQFH